MASKTINGGSKYVPNPYLEGELARSTMLVDDLEAVAHDIMEGAQALAPVAEGNFRDEMAVESGIDDGVMSARFIANNWKAAIIEYGTVEHEFNAPIRTAIERAGYRLVKR